jgi:hypothetical protein
MTPKFLSIDNHIKNRFNVFISNQEVDELLANAVKENLAISVQYRIPGKKIHPDDEKDFNKVFQKKYNLIY